MTDRTARFALPMLHAGQAQKEMTHNEALLALDILLHPEVEAVGQNHPPEAPLPGQCWIVGDAPSGTWAGQEDRIAAWSEGGWRFLRPRDGMLMWSRAEGMAVRRILGAWAVGSLHGTALFLGGAQVVGPQQPPIAMATGGTLMDVEARATIAHVLDALREHGLVARNA